DEEGALQTVLQALTKATGHEAQLLAAEIEIADTLPALRQAEAERGAALARMTAERETLDRDVSRAKERARELANQQTTLANDIARETERLAEAEASERDASDEANKLVAAASDHAAEIAKARSECDLADQAVDAADKLYRERTAEAHARAVARKAAETQRDERSRKRDDLAAAQATLDADRQSHEAAGDKLPPIDDDSRKLQTITDTITALGARTPEIEDAVLAAQSALQDAQAARQTAELSLRALTTEQATLQRLVDANRSKGAAPLSDSLTVAAGFEAALASALGEDLEAALNAGETIYWRDLSSRSTAGKEAANGTRDPALPSGVVSLADYVTAPEALARRLAQIGLCEASDAADLQCQLAVGQRLVSKDGDLWRWDGFVARAGAPTAAATRLEQRNRLDALAKEIKAAKSTVSRLAKLAATAQSDLDTAQASRSAHLRQIRELDAERATIAAEQSKAANARAAYEARTATLADRAERLAAERADAETAFDASVHALQALPNDGALTADISDAERALSDARAGSRNARSKLSEIEREAALTAERQTARSNDARAAQLRGQAAAEQKALLGQRLKAVSEQLGEAESAPAQLEAKRAAIAEALDVASAKRRDAADALA
ncbi:MAG: hypothetical protein AAFR23_10445, partial [Pseudomonadota bacterium]